MTSEFSCVTPSDSSVTQGETAEDLDDRIGILTQFASKPFFNKILKTLTKENHLNAAVICDYIDAERTEINIKQSTIEGKIKVLVWLSRFHSIKNFKEMNKQDIVNYLNSLRKPISQDPMQRWIGTYNVRQMILHKFFKWLYNPSEPNQKKRNTPACMIGIKKLPTKVKSPFRHTDIWYPKEHAIFLKYCPDRRDRCYHAMANDTSARPHELLNLRISDIKFSVTDDGIQYAEVRINEGKTGPRTVPLIDSVRFLKEWIAEHPAGANNNSWIFISRGRTSFGQKLTYDGIVDRYSYYYKTNFSPAYSKIKPFLKKIKKLLGVC
jgi:integrase